MHALDVRLIVIWEDEVCRDAATESRGLPHSWTECLQGRVHALHCLKVLTPIDG